MGFWITNPSASYSVTDQNALTGGSLPFVKRNYVSVRAGEWLSISIAEREGIDGFRRVLAGLRFLGDSRPTEEIELVRVGRPPAPQIIRNLPAADEFTYPRFEVRGQNLRTDFRGPRESCGRRHIELGGVECLVRADIQCLEQTQEDEIGPLWRVVP